VRGKHSHASLSAKYRLTGVSSRQARESGNYAILDALELAKAIKIGVYQRKLGSITQDYSGCEEGLLLDIAV